MNCKQQLGSRFAAVISILLVIFANHAEAIENCVAAGDFCNDDCDCCGYTPEHFQQSTRCETRHLHLGKRCYSCFYTGSHCDKNMDCCSQKCNEGVCVKHDHPVVRPDICYESVLDEIVSMDPVAGIPINGDGLCPCTDLKNRDVSHGVTAVIDKQTNVDYINNYAIGSGLVVTTDQRNPIRKMKVCSNTDCVECDPTSYKLEGKCDNETDYTFIQSGELNFSEERQSCTEVNIVGRHQYYTYKITFPTIRGGFGQCDIEGTEETIIDPACDHTSTDAIGYEGSFYFADSVYDSINDVTTFSYEFKDSFDYFTLPLLQEGHCIINQHQLQLWTGYQAGRLMKATSSFDIKCKHDVKFDNYDDQGNLIPKGNDWWYYTKITLEGLVPRKTGQIGIFSNNRKDYFDITVPDCSMMKNVEPVRNSCNASQDELGDVLQYADTAYDMRHGVTYFSYDFKESFDYFMLPTVGKCHFKGYELRKRSEEYASGLLVKSAPVEILTYTRDNALCMLGAKFDIPLTTEIDSNESYFFVIILEGFVDKTEGQYGILGDGMKGYHNIVIPDCTRVEYPPTNCNNYPMKISEVDLSGKCSEA